jgi:hypothetical protein
LDPEALRSRKVASTVATRHQDLRAGRRRCPKKSSLPEIPMSLLPLLAVILEQETNLVLDRFVP